jgi:PAS domain S-box-containing protein
LHFIVLVVSLFFSFPFAGWGQASQTNPARVLVLHSYHQGFTWTDSIQKGIEAGLADSGVGAEIDVEYLDAKRHPGDSLFVDYAWLFAKQFQDWQPDAIISMDDDALLFLLAHRDDLFPNVPVVFGGLDTESFDGSVLGNGSGYTGVVERLDLRSTLELIRDIQPHVRRVFFVHDQTTSGIMHRRHLEELRPAYEGRIEFIFPRAKGAVSRGELLDTLAKLDADTAVYFTGFFRDRHGRALAEDRIIPAIAEASPVPVYTHVESYFGSGVIGGKMLSAEVHGRSVAQKAATIVKGTPLAETPVTVESSNRYMFDYRVLRRFDISRDRLPEGSIVKFEPTTPFYRYRDELIWAAAGFVLLLAFVAALAVNILKRRLAERRLAANEEKYRALVEKQLDMVVEVDSEGRFLFANPRYLETFGKTESELIGESFMPLVHPDDQPATSEAMESLYRPPHSCSLEQRAWSVDGWRWFAWSDRALIDGEGQVVSIIGVGRDVTDRKEAELRLQETLSEKDLLMKEINHRVKNNLMLVRSLINLKAAELGGKAGANAELSDLMHQIDAIRIVHEKLHQEGRFTSVSMPGYLRQVVETVFAAGTEPGISLKIEVADISLPTKTAVTLGLIVNEIATNAAKHAFDEGDEGLDGSQAPKFSLRLSVAETGTPEKRALELVLSNTGKRIPEDISLESSTGLGINLVGELVKQIGGSIDLKRVPQTCFTIRFEVDEDSGPE